MIYMGNMFKTKNTDFILSPVSTILKDGVSVFNSLNESISLYPIGEYLLSSIFIKMSGAQEQKLRCICWDLATENPEFRFEYLRDIASYGEFSAYTAKNKVYTILVDQISKLDKTFSILNIDFQSIIDNTKKELDSFAECLLFDCFKKQFFSFSSFFKRSFNVNQVGYSVSDKGEVSSILLFNSKLKEIYEEFVYKKRNQIAHNTLSYQYNTQKMTHMNQDMFIHDNYFTRYAVLILIDKIFIALFGEYLDRLVELDFVSERGFLS